MQMCFTIALSIYLLKLKTKKMTKFQTTVKFVYEAENNQRTLFTYRLLLNSLFLFSAHAELAKIVNLLIDNGAEIVSIDLDQIAPDRND